MCEIDKVQILIFNLRNEKEKLKAENEFLKVENEFLKNRLYKYREETDVHKRATTKEKK